MPLVTIQTLPISNDQKRRIADRIVTAFHLEDIPAGSVVVVFRQESLDICLQDGLRFMASEAAPAGGGDMASPSQTPQPSDLPMSPDFKQRTRRTKVELRDLKEQLVKALQLHGTLSSFQAQEALELKACDWAPAALRRFFGELEQEGAILKQGQKRGTRYLWKGITSQPAPSSPMPRLVKRIESEPSLEPEG